MEQLQLAQFFTPGFDMAFHWQLAHKHGLLPQEVNAEVNGNPFNWPGYWNRNGAFVPYPVLYMDAWTEPKVEYIDGELTERRLKVRTYEIRKPSTNAVYCGAQHCPSHLWLEVPWARWELLDLFPRCGLDQKEKEWYVQRFKAQHIDVKQYKVTYGGFEASATGLTHHVLGLPDTERLLPKEPEHVSYKKKKALRPATECARKPQGR